MDRTGGEQRRVISEFLRARLSRRIVFWVFVSIVAIEAIILVPSVYRRERELLNHLKSLSTAQASGILDATDLKPLSPEATLQHLRQIQQNPVVLGGALYDVQGNLIGTFGEVPELQPQLGNSDDRQPTAYYRWRDRYDAVWEMPPLDSRYILVVRHDARDVRQEFFGFIARISGLVLIISVFVTGATMLVLERILIKPVLRLRRDLLKAGAAIQADDATQSLIFESTPSARQDELDDVIRAFERMFGQVSEAIAVRKQSEARFRTLVEQAVDAFFVVNQQGEIIDVNQRACDSLGYTREELLTLKVPDVQQELTSEDFAQIWQLLEPGIPITREGYHRRKNGSSFPVEVRLGVLALGSQKLILALVRDVTERKEAEAAMARLAEVGELAAMIVHEVRSPLTTVVMGLSSFKDLELPERFQMRLALAMEESERLQKLLNEILMYARQQTLKLQPVNLNILLRDVLTLVQAMPAASDRHIHLLLPPEPLQTNGDNDKLKQVFINLVGNACEAVAAGATVTWKLMQQEPGWVMIVVHNQGEPIPADILPKLTQPFVTTKSSGNGLGLAITRRIVEAHQGRLTIASTAQEGTTVTVQLPLYRDLKPV